MPYHTYEGDRVLVCGGRYSYGDFQQYRGEVTEALQKFLNNPAVADLVKDCLDSPAEIIKHLKEKLSEILPNEAPDSLPPLIIDETK